jgi:tRNA threonylcarbamoyladenosine biosynthesis protein TsaB
VSVTQGLAFGAGLPVIGISTLATLAQQAEAPHALALLDARMGELYAGFYARGADGLVDALAPDCLLPPAQLAAAVPALPAGAAWTAIGSGWAAYPELVVAPRTGAARVAEPDAPAVLALAARALARGEAIAPEQLVPAYLRDNVTWKKVGEQGRA